MAGAAATEPLARTSGDVERETRVAAFAAAEDGNRAGRESYRTAVVQSRWFDPTACRKTQPPSLEQRAVELRQRGHNMIHCRQTTFAQGYARDENLGDHIASKYLVWIGLADTQGIESRAARRKAAAAAACDG